MQSSECHCPICLAFIFEPTTTECGQHNFCVSCLEDYFVRTDRPWKCPVCRFPQTTRRVRPNLLLAALMQERFPDEYAAARQRHLPPVVAESMQPPAAVDPPAAVAAPEVQPSSDSGSDSESDSDDDQPPPDPIPLIDDLGDANDPGVAAVAEELFQGAPGEEPAAPLAGMVISVREALFRANARGRSQNDAHLRHLYTYIREHGATTRSTLAREVTHVLVPSFDGLETSFIDWLTQNNRILLTENMLRQRVGALALPAPPGSLAPMLEPRAIHPRRVSVDVHGRPNVILENRRRARDDVAELDALRREFPGYSRHSLRQLRAAIQRNQRRRLS